MSQKIFYNDTFNKKELKRIIHATFSSYGIIKATKLVENLKKSGFHFATTAGISISVEDLKVPPTKNPLFLQTNNEIKRAYFYEKRGNINEIERFQKVIDTWHNTSDLLKNQLVQFFKTVDPLNPLYIMAFSGARGNLSQVRQLVGMRGLMADPNGKIIDLPIKANFREGLTVTDYVISSYGARKGIVDTALKTADAGYLTRRLVDVAQHVIIREINCKTKNGIRLSYNPKKADFEKFIGRTLAKPVIKQKTKKVLLAAETLLTITELQKITTETDLILRSPLICESSRSICQKCYGWNLAQGQLVELADAIGIIAAQSIGEPGTQLTMRTFHTGGIFTGESSNQIRSQEDGEILFSKNLKTSIARTVYGEIILRAENNNFIFILTNSKRLIKIPISPETLIFVQNKSQIKKDHLIAEIPNTNKQTTKQIKNVISPISGEIQFQNIKKNQKETQNNNGLIWVASGEVYDICSNMLLKKDGQIVLKNNSIAQTRIKTPISGIVKYIKPNPEIELSIIQDLATFQKKKIYKNQNTTFIKLNNNYFVKLNSNLKTTNLGTRVTKNYTLPIPYYIAATNKNSLFQTYLIKPCYQKQTYLKLNQNRTLIIPLEKTDNELKHFNKRLIFPGEKLNEKSTIKQLSYCELLTSTNSILILKLTPLTHCGVSTPCNSLVKNTITNFNSHFGEIKVLSKINNEINSKIESDQPFIEQQLHFSHNNQTVNTKIVIKTKKDSINYFSIHRLPQKLIKAELLNSPNSISYWVRQNQYINQSAIIATLNQTVPQKTLIKAVKNLQKNPNRILLATSENYKNYSINSNSPIKNLKFIVIGDKITDNKFIDYCGYNTNHNSQTNLNLRISIPFFISKGTKLFVQHGDLIRNGESFCQLIFSRVISNDIVTGLPRVENLLEARINKTTGQLIENPGVLKAKLENESKIIILEKQKIRTYSLNEQESQIPLKKGEILFVGQPIDNHRLNLHNVLATYFKYYCSLYTAKRSTSLSITNIQILLLNLVQDVYQSQGIYIADKHVETIIRQITSKVRVLRFNIDTFFMPTEFMEFRQVNYINTTLKFVKKPLIEYHPVLLGISKVSLMTESFVSAASFQETTRILAQAAVEGRVEWLRGLKENVILGRLIPAGTGFKSFNSTSLLNVRLNSKN